jgi:hypothetical protein
MLYLLATTWQSDHASFQTPNTNWQMQIQTQTVYNNQTIQVIQTSSLQQ